MKIKYTPSLLAGVLACAVALPTTIARAADFAGNVQGAGMPIAGSTVTLFAAGTGAPMQLAQGKTDDNGAFKLDVAQEPAESVFYVIAKGGTPQAAAEKGPNDAIVLLAVLGGTPPSPPCGVILFLRPGPSAERDRPSKCERILNYRA